MNSAPSSAASCTLMGHSSRISWRNTFLTSAAFYPSMEHNSTISSLIAFLISAASEPSMGHNSIISSLIAFISSVASFPSVGSRWRISPHNAHLYFAVSCVLSKCPSSVEQRFGHAWYHLNYMDVYPMPAPWFGCHRSCLSLLSFWLGAHLRYECLVDVPGHPIAPPPVTRHYYPYIHPCH